MEEIPDRENARASVGDQNVKLLVQRTAAPPNKITGL